MRMLKYKSVQNSGGNNKEDKFGNSLLSGTTRVEVPFIKVTIGDFTFGAFSRQEQTRMSDGFYQTAGITYPNYIQSLNIQKINGQVNQYDLSFVYPITPGDDPNFFEKVFSSVSKTRKIIFSYGDMSMPEYIYRNEKAIITKINTNFDQKTSKITYTVSATSSASLANSAGQYYQKLTNKKPSDVIKDMLKDPKTGLMDLFTGMANADAVKNAGLIADNDIEVDISAQPNMTPLAYIKYLVSCMIPIGTPANTTKIQSFYALTIHDEAENDTLPSGFTANSLGGPYFKIRQVNRNIEHSDAYEVTIGYPTGTLITEFRTENNENYSIYYDYQNKLNKNEFVSRLNDDGEWVREYAPSISSNNDSFSTNAQDKIWWSKITQYPISATLTIRGLLRPALLMEYIRLNVLFYGHKHISSGLYIITKQVDNISANGYRTTLSLTKVAGEEQEDYV